MESTPILIRFEDKLLKKVDDLAILERRSRTKMVNTLIEEAIKNREVTK